MIDIAEYVSLVCWLTEAADEILTALASMEAMQGLEKCARDAWPLVPGKAAGPSLPGAVPSKMCACVPRTG